MQQLQKRLLPGVLLVTEEFDRGTEVGTADDGQDRDQENALQSMQPCAARARLYNMSSSKTLFESV